MLGYRFGDDLFQVVYPDDIGQECICDKERKQEESDVFPRFTDDFLRGPGRFVQQFLLRCRTFDPVFQSAEKHFHKDGLRAGPTAEQSSECSGEENNEYDERDHGQGEDEEILGPEYFGEENEFSLRDIDLEQGDPVNINERHAEEQYKIHPTQYRATGVPFSFWLLRINPVALTGGGNGGERVAEGLGWYGVWIGHCFVFYNGYFFFSQRRKDATPEVYCLTLIYTATD